MMEKLVGDVGSFDISAFDCYVREQFGIFIPIYNDRDESAEAHSHPAYEIIIDFEKDSDKAKHYWAKIISPGVVHKRSANRHGYHVFIERSYFESRF